MKAKESNVENPSDVKGYVLRRSPRAMVRIPVFIKGIDKNGYEFEEESETFVVSKYGARIYTVHELEEDSILQVRIKSSERWSDFRIVWIGKQEDNALGHIGIEFIQTTDFFGVIFPGEDWT